MINRHNIGVYFKKRRLEKGLSQLDVSRILGYSSSQFVSNWERGLCMPPLISLSKLCEIYGIPKSEIIDMMTTEYRKHLNSALKKKSRNKRVS